MQKDFMIYRVLSLVREIIAHVFSLKPCLTKITFLRYIWFSIWAMDHRSLMILPGRLSFPSVTWVFIAVL